MLSLFRSLIRCVPDLPITRGIPRLGPLTFGLRRHRWMLGDDPMAGHLGQLGMFRSLIDDGAVVYDIGANIGYYACFMARHFPVKQVAAFEPMTANLKLLRRNAARCGDKVRVLAMALGDVDAREALQLDDVSDGSAVLDRISGGKPAETRAALGLNGKTEEVQVRTLDGVVAELELPPPTFMKIDTEGAEAIVLRGAKETLTRHGPHLAIALHGPDKAVEVFRMLTSLGYTIYGYRATADRDWGSLDETSIVTAHNNIVASRDVTRLKSEPEAFAATVAP